MSTDKNNLVYQEQLDDNVIEMLSEDIGSNYSLRTENTKTIVAALNEILGKDIICNAVGSPLLTTDTFAELGEKINVMVSDFKAKLLGLGVSVSSVDKLASLIEKIGEIDLGVDAEELMAPLEESLREILGDEGVELSGEESLAELIVKVDEKFDYNKQYLVDKLISVDINASMDNTWDDLVDLIDVKSNRRIEKIVNGYEHTFVLTNDNILYAAGLNDRGQLGLGDNENRSVITRVNTDLNGHISDIVCGGYFSFVLKDDGTIWFTGGAAYGQSGMGSKTNYSSFTQVPDVTDVKQISCGGYHTIILKENGEVWACGRNTNGQLGVGNNTNEVNLNFIKIEIDNVKKITCGDQSSHIIKNDGSLWSCGLGWLGLNGATNGNYSFTQVITNINNDVNTTDGTYLLKNDGTVWLCGYNIELTEYYKTYTKISDIVFKQIASSSSGNRVIGIGEDNSIYVMGNGYGFGLNEGTAKTYTSFVKVETNINNDVKQVISRDNNFMILKNDGTVWACGVNNQGECALSEGMDNIRYIFTKIDMTPLYK